jgi:hypothetical protein
MAKGHKYATDLADLRIVGKDGKVKHEPRDVKRRGPSEAARRRTAKAAASHVAARKRERGRTKPKAA